MSFAIQLAFQEQQRRLISDYQLAFDKIIVDYLGNLYPDIVTMIDQMQVTIPFNQTLSERYDIPDINCNEAVFNNGLKRNFWLTEGF